MARKSIFKSEEGKIAVLGFYEKLLANWPEPSKQHLLETSYGCTFVIESGKATAPPVILLHGSGSNSAMWIADAEKLSNNCRVIAIDIIGECGNSCENRPDFKGNHYAVWLLEILNQLEINKCSLISCSLGAWIGIDFTIKHPERVNKLVLLAPAGITQLRPKLVFLIIITSVSSNWGFKRLNKMVYRNVAIDDQALKFIAQVRDNYLPRTNALPLFSDETLQQIKAPTLFIGGEYDCFYNSHKSAFRLESHLAHADCRVLKDTGHVLVNQTETIMQFLAD